jgi:hypothetical protein
MQQRDADGRAVMIDDPRFDPLLDWLEKRHYHFAPTHTHTCHKKHKNDRRY